MGPCYSFVTPTTKFLSPTRKKHKTIIKILRFFNKGIKLSTAGLLSEKEITRRFFGHKHIGDIIIF